MIVLEMLANCRWMALSVLDAGITQNVLCGIPGGHLFALWDGYPEQSATQCGMNGLAKITCSFSSYRPIATNLVHLIGEECILVSVTSMSLFTLVIVFALPANVGADLMWYFLA